MICGASGTGKTTLAKHISELYELPYISTSASHLWSEFGFTSHEDSIKKCMANPKLGTEYQFRVLANRLAAFKSQENFVTDRSFMDNVVYALLQQTFETCDLEILFKECSIGMMACDLLIYIAWHEDIILEEDSKRIFNRYYQRMVDQIMHWVVFSEVIHYHGSRLKLRTWDFETRVQLVDKWIKKL